VGFLIGFFLVLAAIFLVLGLMDPRTVHRKVVAWQYRDPEANEPSDAALVVGRVSYFLGAGVLVVMAMALGSVLAENTYDRSEVMSVASAAAAKLRSGPAERRTPVSVRSDVLAAVGEAGGDRIKIESSGPDTYEITNTDGDHPVCLRVTTESDLDLGWAEPWSPTVEATVSDGRCGG
jgi:hypothetical protein